MTSVLIMEDHKDLLVTSQLNLTLLPLDFLCAEAAAGKVADASLDIVGFSDLTHMAPRAVSHILRKHHIYLRRNG